MKTLFELSDLHGYNQIRPIYMPDLQGITFTYASLPKDGEIVSVTKGHNEEDNVLDSLVCLLSGEWESIWSLENSTKETVTKILPGWNNLDSYRPELNVAVSPSSITRTRAIEDSVHVCVAMHDMHKYDYSVQYVTYPEIDSVITVDKTGLSTWIFVLDGSTKIQDNIYSRGRYLEVIDTIDIEIESDDVIILVLSRLSEYEDE